MNQMVNENRYSGNMMWPGGDQRFVNQRAKYIEPYGSNLPIFKRIDKVIT